MKMISKEQIGLGAIASFLTTAITIVGAGWFILKPILQASLTEAMAEEIIKTQEDLSQVVSSLTALQRIVLQDEVDEEVERIADLEFKRDFSEEDWTPDDQTRLNRANQRLQAAQTALDNLD